MLNVAIKSVMLSVVMLNIAIKSIMVRVFKLNVVAALLI